jgi:predicted nucleotidyltransferase
MLKERFKELGERLLTEARNFYGDRLITVAVFGSVGRGTQRFDSDTDVLVIADGLPTGRMKRIREFDASVEIKLEQFIKSLKKEGIDTYISAIIKTPEEIKAGSLLFLDMIEDARILYDRGGFFEGVLKELRERLDRLGSKRVWRGSAWHWILKPDYKPGEVFEI